MDALSQIPRKSCLPSCETTPSASRALQESELFPLSGCLCYSFWAASAYSASACPRRTGTRTLNRLRRRDRETA